MSRFSALARYTSDELHGWSSRVSAQTEGQNGTPQDTNGRNFVPKRDMTRYDE
jgi:hypothetical protein